MKFPRQFTRLIVASFTAIAALPTFALPVDVTYTFEQFPAPVIGPLHNVAPDLGTNLFHADFAAANAAILAIGTVGGLSGNALVTASNSLQVTLSSAVTSITVAFAGLNKKFDFVFNSSAGSKTVMSKGIAKELQGGSLTFTSANPFTSFTLTSTQAGFGIDNLILGLAAAPAAPAAVPESGSTILLLGFAVCVLSLTRRRLAS